MGFSECPAARDFTAERFNVRNNKNTGLVTASTQDNDINTIVQPPHLSVLRVKTTEIVSSSNMSLG
jgi:hypothetical protein